MEKVSNYIEAFDRELISKEELLELIDIYYSGVDFLEGDDEGCNICTDCSERLNCCDVEIADEEKSFSTRMDRWYLLDEIRIHEENILTKTLAMEGFSEEVNAMLHRLLEIRSTQEKYENRINASKEYIRQCSEKLELL